MKNKDLIEKLQQYPDDVEVCIFDYKVNEYEADAEGTSEGVYSNFEIELMEPPEVKKQFIAIGFENTYIDYLLEELNCK